jgi:hypothetical protein
MVEDCTSVLSLEAELHRVGAEEGRVGAEEGR